MIRPCFSKLSRAVRTVFDGMAKPIPCEPPVREMMAVLMPMTSPRKLINGPPLFPGLIAALVCSRSPKKSVRFGRPFALMIPSVTVSSHPYGFRLDTDFFRRFYCDNGRDHAANERAPLPVQRLERRDLL